MNFHPKHEKYLNKNSFMRKKETPDLLHVEYPELVSAVVLDVNRAHRVITILFAPRVWPILVCLHSATLKEKKERSELRDGGRREEEGKREEGEKKW